MGHQVDESHRQVEGLQATIAALKDDHAAQMNEASASLLTSESQFEADLAETPWQFLLRESSVSAFIGESSSLVSNPTCTNIQAHSHDSELEPRGDHVEQGPR